MVLPVPGGQQRRPGEQFVQFGQPGVEGRDFVPLPPGFALGLSARLTSSTRAAGTATGPQPRHNLTYRALTLSTVK